MSDSVCSGQRMISHCRKKVKKTQSSWRSIRNSADTIRQEGKMYSLAALEFFQVVMRRLATILGFLHFLVSHFIFEDPYQALPSTDPPLSPREHLPCFPSQGPASQAILHVGGGFLSTIPTFPRPWPWQLWEALPTDIRTNINY